MDGWGDAATDPSAASKQPSGLGDRAGEAATDRYAAFKQYGNSYEEHHSAIKRMTAQGQFAPPPNPLAEFEPEVLPTTGPNGKRFFVNPWNPDGQPLSQEQWQTLQGKMEITHSTSPQAQANAYKERKVAGAAGGIGHEPMTVTQVMTTNAVAYDDHILNNPESVDPDILRIYREDSKKIRILFTDMMKNAQGSPTWTSLKKMGNQLMSQFEDHPRYIGNLLEDQADLNVTVMKELQQLRMTGRPDLNGNELFKGLPIEDQSLYKQGLEIVKAKGDFMPELMEALGFQENAESFGPRWITGNGDRRPVGAEDVLKAAEARWGIGAPAPEMPAEPEAIPEEPRLVEGETGVRDPDLDTVGIKGVMSGSDGKKMFTLRDGKRVSNKIDAQHAIDSIMTPKEGKPLTEAHIALAKKLSDTFGAEMPATPTPPKPDPSVTEATRKYTPEELKGFEAIAAKYTAKSNKKKEKAWLGEAIGDLVNDINNAESPEVERALTSALNRLADKLTPTEKKATFKKTS